LAKLFKIGNDRAHLETYIYTPGSLAISKFDHFKISNFEIFRITFQW